MAQRKRGGTFQKRGGIGGKDKSEEASASSASIVATGLDKKKSGQTVSHTIDPS